MCDSTVTISEDRKEISLRVVIRGLIRSNKTEQEKQSGESQNKTANGIRRVLTGLGSRGRGK